MGLAENWPASRGATTDVSASSAWGDTIPLQRPNILAFLPDTCVHTLALVRLAASEFWRDSGVGNLHSDEQADISDPICQGLVSGVCHPAPGLQPNASATGPDQWVPPGSPRELSPAFLAFFLTALISDDSFVVYVPSPLFLYFVLFIVTS